MNILSVTISHFFCGVSCLGSFHVCVCFWLSWCKNSCWYLRQHHDTYFRVQQTGHALTSERMPAVCSTKVDIHNIRLHMMLSGQQYMSDHCSWFVNSTSADNITWVEYTTYSIWAGHTTWLDHELATVQEFTTVHEVTTVHELQYMRWPQYMSDHCKWVDNSTWVITVHDFPIVHELPQSIHEWPQYMSWLQYMSDYSTWVTTVHEWVQYMNTVHDQRRAVCMDAKGKMKRKSLQASFMIYD